MYAVLVVSFQYSTRRKCVEKCLATFSRYEQFRKYTIVKNGGSHRPTTWKATQCIKLKSSFVQLPNLTHFVSRFDRSRVVLWRNSALSTESNLHFEYRDKSHKPLCPDAQQLTAQYYAVDIVLSGVLPIFVGSSRTRVLKKVSVFQGD
jgi:hypothetical protein